MRKILNSGGAGLIGFHLCRVLIKNGDFVVTIDNFNSYYTVSLKKDRIELGLRFFTVYGPWGRPDIALFLFIKAIFSMNQMRYLIKV